MAATAGTPAKAYAALAQAGCAVPPSGQEAAVRVDQLPTEVLQRILAVVPQADPAELARLALVSRAFNQALQGASCLWRNLRLRHYGCVETPTALSSFERWLRPRCAQTSSLELELQSNRQDKPLTRLLAPRLEQATLWGDILFGCLDRVWQAEFDQLCLYSSERLVTLALWHLPPSVRLEHLTALAGLRTLRLSFGSGDAGPFPTALCSLTQLTELELMYNGLRLLPNALSRLTALRQLSVKAGSCNSCRCQPQAVAVEAGLWQMRSLAQLSMTDCALTADWPSLSAMTALSTLSLSRCHVNGGRFPAGCFAAPALRALRCLHVTGCGLDHLPRGGLSALQDLALERCEPPELPEAACHLRGLRRLSLAWTRLEALPRAISRLASLRELCLRDSDPVPRLNAYTGDEGQPGSLFLPHELAELSQLRVVDLRHTAFTLEPGLALRLAAMPRLERVRLAGALPSPQGVRELVKLGQCLGAQGRSDKVLQW